MSCFVKLLTLITPRLFTKIGRKNETEEVLQIIWDIPILLPPITE